jgi:hypothetical protein
MTVSLSHMKSSMVGASPGLRRVAASSARASPASSAVTSSW